MIESFSIENLYDEIADDKILMKKMDKEIERLSILCNEREEEIDKLNNIIDELEKWLIKHIDEYRDMEQDAMFEFGLVLDKLKALKENK